MNMYKYILYIGLYMHVYNYRCVFPVCLCVYVAFVSIYMSVLVEILLT